MAIVLIAPTKNNLDYWQEALRAEAEKTGIEVPVWIGPEVEDPARVKMAVVWKHQPQSLYQYPSLQLVSSMGAGVDHILKDQNMPAHWQLSRIVDPQLTSSMSNYLLAAVLGYHKRLDEWQKQQQQKVWAYSDEPELALRIGVLGMGELGSDIAGKLAGLGFPVFGYSNSFKKLPGVKSYAGEDQLAPFLSQVNVLICLLPLTEKTRNFLDRSFFSKCRKGTFLINVARGEHLVEADLLWALEQEYLSRAMLDVFREEPLPTSHPFWSHPQISITPHIASVTDPSAAIPQIIENYHRLMNDEEPVNKINRSRGY
jgi:glyoxylate/hydroxypyruvate reductase A